MRKHALQHHALVFKRIASVYQPLKIPGNRKGQTISLSKLAFLHPACLVINTRISFTYESGADIAIRQISEDHR